MSIETWLHEHEQDMVRDLQALCRIPSVKEEPAEGAPFGRPIRDALDAALDMARRLGFTTVNCDGYAGHAEMGSGDEIVGILCHLDVVPATGPWRSAPFDAEIRDASLIARGVCDDKGPSIAALYAMAAVKAQGIDLNKRVRILFGCDEESGWEDIAYYRQHEAMPDIGFAPDAEYPVIHAEKGILHVELSGPALSGDSAMIALYAGSRPNVVPDEAVCVLDTNVDERQLARRVQDEAALHSGMLRLEGDDMGLLIKSSGVSAHAMAPHHGKNAASSLLACVCRLFLVDAPLRALSDIAASLDGRELNLALRDEPSGALTMNLGVLQCDREACRAVLDIRYPVTYTQEQIMERLAPAAKERGLDCRILHAQPPLFVPKDDPLVEKLQGVYAHVTGKSLAPLAIGGGTYARAMRHGVAFGARFPGTKDMAHQCDEAMPLQELFLNARIFAHAIEALLS